MTRTTPNGAEWSLGSHWMGTTSPIDLSFDSDGASAPTGDYNKHQPTTRRQQQRRPVDPDHSGWSLGFHWTATITSLVDLSFDSDGASAPTGDYNNASLQPDYYNKGLQLTRAYNPGWSLGFHWMAATLQSLMTRATTRMEFCLPSETTLQAR